MASPLHRAIRIVISQFVPQSSEMSKPVATVGGPVINLYNVGTDYQTSAITIDKQIYQALFKLLHRTAYNALKKQA